MFASFSYDFGKNVFDVIDSECSKPWVESFGQAFLFFVSAASQVWMSFFSISMELTRFLQKPLGM